MIMLMKRIHKKVDVSPRPRWRWVLID